MEKSEDERSSSCTDSNAGGEEDDLNDNNDGKDDDDEEHREVIGEEAEPLITKYSSSESSTESNGTKRKTEETKNVNKTDFSLQWLIQQQFSLSNTSPICVDDIVYDEIFSIAHDFFKTRELTVRQANALVDIALQRYLNQHVWMTISVFKTFKEFDMRGLAMFCRENIAWRFKSANAPSTEFEESFLLDIRLKKMCFRSDMISVEHAMFALLLMPIFVNLSKNVKNMFKQHVDWVTAEHLFSPWSNNIPTGVSVIKSKSTSFILSSRKSFWYDMVYFHNTDIDILFYIARSYFFEESLTIFDASLLFINFSNFATSVSALRNVNSKSLTFHTERIKSIQACIFIILLRNCDRPYTFPSIVDTLECANCNFINLNDFVRFLRLVILPCSEIANINVFAYREIYNILQKLICSRLKKSAFSMEEIFNLQRLFVSAGTRHPIVWPITLALHFIVSTCDIVKTCNFMMDRIKATHMILSDVLLGQSIDIIDIHLSLRNLKINKYYLSDITSFSSINVCDLRNTFMQELKYNLVYVRDTADIILHTYNLLQNAENTLINDKLSITKSKNEMPVNSNEILIVCEEILKTNNSFLYDVTSKNFDSHDIHDNKWWRYWRDIIFHNKKDVRCVDSSIFSRYVNRECFNITRFKLELNDKCRERQAKRLSLYIKFRSDHTKVLKNRCYKQMDVVTNVLLNSIDTNVFTPLECKKIITRLYRSGVEYHHTFLSKNYDEVVRALFELKLLNLCTDTEEK